MNEASTSVRNVKKSAPNPFLTFVRGPIISTPTALNNEATPSLAFAYLSSFIAQQGYRFEIVDGIAEALNQIWPLDDFPGFQIQGLPISTIVERIPCHTDVVAISAMFSGDWPVVRLMIREIRQKFPEALIIAGGEHITALSEYCLRECPELDLSVLGEGEQSLLDILQCVKNGTLWDAVEGVAWVDASGAFHSPEKPPRIRKIDEIPWPVWQAGYLENFWSAGKSYGVQSERDMPIMASRGCPYQCTFCSNPAMWTTRYILRDVDDLISEIKLRIEEHDITSLQFYDLTAITKKRWTVEFCNRLIAENINLKWSLPSGTRSEALDEDTLTLLRATGCNYLVYAPESGSPETLKLINKRINLDELTRSAVTAVKLGIVTRTNLIIGFPHETRKNIFETLWYGLKLAFKGIDEVSIYIFSPYPGTAIFKNLVDNKKLIVNDDYFMSLTSLNGDYFQLSPICVCENVTKIELALYRLVFMSVNYLIGYITRPSRIIRTLQNIFFDGLAVTVLEHRLKDAFQRRHAKKVQHNVFQKLHSDQL